MTPVGVGHVWVLLVPLAVIVAAAVAIIILTRQK